MLKTIKEIAEIVILFRSIKKNMIFPFRDTYVIDISVHNKCLINIFWFKWARAKS